MKTQSPFSFIRSLPLATVARSIGADVTPRFSGARHCVREDDRTVEQKQTHVWAIVARDDACRAGAAPLVVQAGVLGRAIQTLTLTAFSIGSRVAAICSASR